MSTPLTGRGHSPARCAAGLRQGIESLADAAGTSDPEGRCQAPGQNGADLCLEQAAAPHSGGPGEVLARPEGRHVARRPGRSHRGILVDRAVRRRPRRTTTECGAPGRDRSPLHRRDHGPGAGGVRDALLAGMTAVVYRCAHVARPPPKNTRPPPASDRPRRGYRIPRVQAAEKLRPARSRSWGRP